MEIILLSRRRGSLVRLRVGRLGAAAAVLVAAVACTALFVSGRESGIAQKTRADLLEDAAGAREPWERAILRQRRELAGVRTAVERDAKALAVRLGAMQAQVARLDALGERLAAMAGLAANEFAFDQVPGRGGPHAERVLTAATVSEVSGDVEDLAALIERHTQELTALEAVLMRTKLEASTQPAGQPLATGWVSSWFGLRIDPMSGAREFHSGVDFTGRPGAEVRAVAAGVVAFSGSKAEYGNTVAVNHGDGYLTRYSHNKRNLVKVGDKVAPGQIIALMGATGRTTGAHVHFEVERDGRIVNPAPYLRAKRD
jgi:murein DD-endopeptidase MepM/ murein hydrolase activator NlpD